MSANATTRTPPMTRNAARTSASHLSPIRVLRVPPTVMCSCLCAYLSFCLPVFIFVSGCALVHSFVCVFFTALLSSSVSFLFYLSSLRLLCSSALSSFFPSPLSAKLYGCLPLIIRCISTTITKGYECW